MKIIIDSREKLPYKFPGVDSVVYKQLNVGDYTLDGFEDRFSVERKSLNDLATSLGADRERFENEIKRAQDLDKFVVVIEADRSEVADFAHTNHCPNYYSKIYPKSIISTVESWPDKYSTLEFEWAGSREEAKQETLRLLDKWYVQHASDLY